MTERKLRVVRILLFGLLTWMPVQCLMNLWHTYSYTAASRGEPYGPDGWEVIFYSAPYPRYFVIAIATGAGLVTVVWMLTRRRVPGWEALGITAVLSFAVSACLYHHAVKVQESYWFISWGFSDKILDHRILSILILDVEVAVIASLLWKWRRQWLFANKSAPIAGDPAPAGAPPVIPAPVRPFRAAVQPAFVLLASGGFFLLAWGASWLASSPEERGNLNHRELCESRLAGATKDDPRRWIAAARDVARARAVEIPEAGVAELWQEIIELEEAVYGKDSPGAISDTFFLADFLLKYRRPAEAEKWLRRYIEACARRHSEDHPFLDSARKKLEIALRDQGKPAEPR